VARSPAATPGCARLPYPGAHTYSPKFDRLIISQDVASGSSRQLFDLRGGQDRGLSIE
jgi:hypothetical protein